MLTLTDITLTYPDGDSRLTAVERASLSVAPGQMAALIGASGSGKSSLLSVAATLVTPDSGKVEIDGIEATGLDQAGRSRVRREKLGIVFQAPNLIPSLTVAEQLEVMSRLSGAKASRARITELLADVGMDHFSGRKPGQLSGGQRQRVNIARAMVHAPSALLVDEPTSALDQERSRDIMELLTCLTHERNLATLLVTHDLGQLENADAVYRMADGVVTREK